MHQTPYPHKLPWQALQQRLALALVADPASMVRLLCAAVPGASIPAGPVARSWLVRALLDVRPVA